MAITLIKVDEITKVTDTCIHCRFEGMEKPLYISRAMRGETCDVVNLKAGIVECYVWLAKKTAEALGLELEDIEKAVYIV